MCTWRMPGWFKAEHVEWLVKGRFGVSEEAAGSTEQAMIGAPRRGPPSTKTLCSSEDVKTEQLLCDTALITGSSGILWNRRNKTFRLKSACYLTFPASLLHSAPSPAGREWSAGWSPAGSETSATETNRKPWGSADRQPATVSMSSHSSRRDSAGQHQHLMSSSQVSTP